MEAEAPAAGAKKGKKQKKRPDQEAKASAASKGSKNGRDRPSREFPVSLPALCTRSCAKCQEMAWPTDANGRAAAGSIERAPKGPAKQPGFVVHESPKSLNLSALRTHPLVTTHGEL